MAAAQARRPADIPPVLPLWGTPTAEERALLRRHPEVAQQLVLQFDAVRPTVVVFDTTLRRRASGARERWTAAERTAVLARAARAGAEVREQLVRPVHFLDRRANASVALEAAWGGAGVLVVRPGEPPRLLPAAAIRGCDQACWHELAGARPTRHRRSA
jgi:hypothetical protein